MSVLTRIRDAWQPSQQRGYNVLESLLSPRNVSGFSVTDFAPGDVARLTPSAAQSQVPVGLGAVPVTPVPFDEASQPATGTWERVK